MRAVRSGHIGEHAAREEGYFRREWNLAASRTLDMAEDKTFLLPVVIDATLDARARVPEKFRDVQWTHLPNGEAAQRDPGVIHTAVDSFLRPLHGDPRGCLFCGAFAWRDWPTSRRAGDRRNPCRPT